MAINVLDNRTEAVINTEASRIGFLGKYPSSESIIHTLQPADGAIEPRSVVFVDDKRVADVYRIPVEAAAQVRILDLQMRSSEPEATNSESTGDTRSQIKNALTTLEAVFVAEWNCPVSTGSRGDVFQIETFLFETSPGSRDIHIATELDELSFQFTFGELDMQFVCEHCNQEIHWTDVPTASPAPLEVPLQTRITLVEDRRCGCQGNDGSNTVRAAE